MSGKCVEDISHSLIKVEENKRKATFRNPAKLPYQRIQVDNCLITAGVRSDAIVREIGTMSVFVELKGVDVAHACDQLFATAKHASVRPYLEDQAGFLVVCSKYPRFDSFVAKAKQRAAKEFKAGFHVVTDKGEFDAARVCAIDGPY